MEMSNPQITLDIPIQVAFFVLQHSKLLMLAYYYRFFDIYMDRSDFCMLDMETRHNTFHAYSFTTISICLFCVGPLILQSVHPLCHEIVYLCQNITIRHKMTGYDV